MIVDMTNDETLLNASMKSMFADARFNNAYPAIVKVKLFVCIGEMISFRYGTRISVNLTQ